MPNPFAGNATNVMVADNGGGYRSAANSGKTVYQSGSSSFGYGSNYDYLRQITAENNAFNLQQTAAVNAFNAREAEKNRQWQERMSRHAHEYEVEDLIRAGLNPVLSAGGQGAYVGSGGVASGQKAIADSTLSSGAISLMSAAMSAASAENVARIYAAASMYGADKGQENQNKYVQALIDNNLLTNETSAKNNENTNDTNAETAKLGIYGRIIQAVLGSMLYYRYGQKNQYRYPH